MDCEARLLMLLRVQHELRRMGFEAPLQPATNAAPVHPRALGELRQTLACSRDKHWRADPFHRSQFGNVLGRVRVISRNTFSDFVGCFSVWACLGGIKEQIGEQSAGGLAPVGEGLGRGYY